MTGIPPALAVFAVYWFFVIFCFAMASAIRDRDRE